MPSRNTFFKQSVLNLQLSSRFSSLDRIYGSHQAKPVHNTSSPDHLKNPACITTSLNGNVNTKDAGCNLRSIIRFPLNSYFVHEVTKQNISCKEYVLVTKKSRSSSRAWTFPLSTTSALVTFSWIQKRNFRKETSSVDLIFETPKTLSLSLFNPRSFNISSL